MPDKAKHGKSSNIAFDPACHVIGDIEVNNIELLSTNFTGLLNTFYFFKI